MPYRVEYATSARSKCKLTTCGQSKIEKGALRFGTWLDTGRFQSWQWRHWGCVTPKVLEHVKEFYNDVEKEMDGFEELKEDDKQRVKNAVESGDIAEEDKTIPGKESDNNEEYLKEDEQKDELDEEKEDVAAEKTPKKRGRTKKSEEKVSDEPKVETAEHTASRSKRTKRGEPKNYNEDISEDGFEDEGTIPKKKAPKSKKAKDTEDGDEKPKARRRSKKNENNSPEVPKKRGRPTKKVTTTEGQNSPREEEATEPKSAEVSTE